MAVRTFAVVECLRAAAGKSGKRVGTRAIQKRLRLAVEHGRLIRAERGWLTVPDDALTGLPDAPQAAQPTALVAPTAPAVVISATGPACRDQPVEVVATAPAETVTAVCTASAPPEPVGLKDLLEVVDERSAILEHDGGHDRDAADLLAREMVMGRGVVVPVAPAERVGVDHLSLKARMHHLVDAAVQRFGGTVRVIGDEEDPFPRKQAARPPGACTCGSCESIDVPIHDGRSSRRECAQCGRFKEFAVWYGRRLAVPSPDDPPDAAASTGQGRDRLSFLLTAPIRQTTGPMTAA